MDNMRKQEKLYQVLQGLPIALTGADGSILITDGNIPTPPHWKRSRTVKVRSGTTKNHGQPRKKQRSKTAKQSRRKNRG